MNNEQQQRVAVIGAGVIGLNTAYQLQKNGFEVTIFDGNGVASDASASYGNAGHFATEQVFPLADPSLLAQLPKMLIDPLGPFKIKPSYFFKAIPWFIRFLAAMPTTTRSKNSVAIKALNQASLASWTKLADEIGCPDSVVQHGSLLTFESVADDVINKEIAKYREQGVEVDYVDGDILQMLAPCLDDKVRGALHFTQVGHTPCPAQLCERLHHAFVALGGKVELLHADSVVDINPIQVVCGDKAHTFERVVICAGAHAKKFTSPLGYKVPLETERGYHLMLPIQLDLSLPVASNDRKFIMTPMKDGLRLAGTVEFAGLEHAPDYQRSEMMLKHAKAMLDPIHVPDIESIDLKQLAKEARWMGFRPSLPDSLPVMDNCAKNPNIFFNFGHQHLGLTWGAIAGEIICDMLLGKQPALDIKPYRITRF